MTPAEGGAHPPGASAQVASAVGAAHRHRWRGIEFFFRAEHPWFRLACDCGASRSVRAWERYWDPRADSTPPAGRSG